MSDAQPTQPAPREHPTHPTVPGLPEAAADPSARIGRFVRLSKLGEGAMGEVWKAWDAGLNRAVALKLPKGGDEEELARFRREAETAAALAHPNIAAIYEVGVAEGPSSPPDGGASRGKRPYIAMQFVEGRTLRAMRRCDRREAARMMRDAARAVHHAHGHRIVHRDLKPENVMVDTAGRVFVMDFGLARSVAPVTGLTLSGMMVGTPSYMSPEQARAQAVDVRSDVYGLGATFFDLLTGRPPFAGPSVYETVMKVVQDPAPSARSLDASIDEELDAVVAKCLEKEPERRYADAENLAADLDRWLRGEPVTARPVSMARKLAWRFGRQRVAIALAGIGLLVLLGAGVVALRAHFEERRQRDAIEAARVRREAALQQLQTQYERIVQCKNELRQAKRPAGAAREDLFKAVLSLEDYVREWPDEPQGYYVRGRGRLYLDDFDGAERDARRTLECRADFRPGWSLLGLVKMYRWLRMDHGTDYDQKWRKALRKTLLPEAVDAFERGRPATGAQEEAARWGLAWNREDHVLDTLAQGLKMERDQDMSAVHDWFSRAAKQYASEEVQLILASRCRNHASHHYDDVIRLAPGWELGYLSRGHYHHEHLRQPEAIADFTRALELRPDLWIALLLRGAALASLRRYREAAADLDRAVSLRPDYAPLHYNRALHRDHSGDARGAVADYDRAIELAPDYDAAWSNRASMREQLGDHDGARRDYDKALELDPLDVISHCGRGYLRKKTGDVEGALADYSRAIQIKPEEAAEAFDARGSILTDRGQADRAIADHDRAVRLKPEVAAYWFNRSRALEQTGDRAGARADLDECLKRDRSIAGAWVSRAQLRSSAGEFEAAVEDCTEGLVVHPKHYNLYIVRAGARLQMGEWENALDDIEEAVRVDPKLPEAYSYRGQIRQYQKDDLAGAIADYEKALALAPRGWPSRKAVTELLERAKKQED